VIGNWANGGAREMELEMSSSALVPDSPPIGALKQEYRSIHEYSTTPHIGIGCRFGQVED